MSAFGARAELVAALNRLAEASVESADQRIDEALSAADRYAFEAGYTPVPILDAAEIRTRVAIVEAMTPADMRTFIAHLAGWNSQVFDEVAHEILPETGRQP